MKNNQSKNIWVSKNKPWKKINVIDYEKNVYYDYETNSIKTGLVSLSYSYMKRRWSNPASYLWPLLTFEIKYLIVILSLPLSLALGLPIFPIALVYMMTVDTRYRIWLY